MSLHSTESSDDQRPGPSHCHSLGITEFVEAVVRLAHAYYQAHVEQHAQPKWSIDEQASAFLNRVVVPRAKFVELETFNGELRRYVLGHNDVAVLTCNRTATRDTLMQHRTALQRVFDFYLRMTGDALHKVHSNTCH